MFIIKSVSGEHVDLDAFDISGSKYTPEGEVYVKLLAIIYCVTLYKMSNVFFSVSPFSSQGGSKVNCSSYDGLVELSTICALCNDSSLDYNEVRV